MMVSVVLSFFPRDVLDEILNLIESVSEDFPSYSLTYPTVCHAVAQYFLVTSSGVDATRCNSLRKYKFKMLSFMSLFNCQFRSAKACIV